MTYPIPILLYHHVNPRGASSTTQPDEFHCHLAWLARKGWRTLTLAEFEAAVLGKKPAGARRFLLTFDDGSADLPYSATAMRSFGFTGVAFVITSQLDQADPDFLQADAIKELAASGVFEIQSHTHRHVHVRDQPEDLDALKADLTASRTYLTTRLGVGAEAARHLAWPWGECTPAMEAAARDLGFTWQYLVQRGALTITGEQVRLPRLCADGISTAQLAAWMSVFASRGGTRLTNKIFGAIRKHRRGLAYG